MVGSILGNRYEILELIGTGGMANVYKARCTLLNRFVAVKILKDEYKNDEEFIKRFNIESQAAAGLSHTNIVSVYDMGAQDDIHYIVMEYVDGITLKEYFKRAGKALDVDTALDFSIQIASALQQAHKRGIVHRDIKPQNIMVTKDGTLKVTDFGIARAVSSFTMKVDDSAIGTAHYCSPEQARGGYTDERSDIYSLGVVMYEMFTGKLPFESDSSVTVAIKQIQEDPVPPTEIMPSVPTEIEDIILRSMQKDQNQRFQNAREMLLELNWLKQTIHDGPYSQKKSNAMPELSQDFINVMNMNKDETSDTSSSPENYKREYKNGSALEEYRLSKNSKKAKTRKKNKTSNPKEDKTAVVAAIISSIVVVCVLGFIGIMFLFPELVSFGGKAKEFEVPDFIGVSYEKAEQRYDNIAFSVEYDYSSAYDEGYIMFQDPEMGTILTEEPYRINITVSKGMKETSVPDVRGVAYSDAIEILEREQLTYTVKYEKSDEVEENVVIDISPEPDTLVKVGKDTIVLVVSEGAEEKTVEVPNVLGLTEQEASTLIAESNLKYSIAYQASTKTKGIVILQSTSAKTTVPEGTVVTITVSAGQSATTGGTNVGGSEQTDVTTNN